MSNRPRILFGATGSNSGKTTLVSGMLRAFQMIGKKPMAYKCGPDYIDPMFHREALGIASRNLDLFFTNKEIVKQIIYNNSKDKDISIIEGVMGYFDGISMTSNTASAYDVAMSTNTPAVILFDGRGKASTIMADIYGYLALKENTGVKGVIINRVSPMVYPHMKKMIEEEFESYGLKVYGYLPKMEGYTLESRHLGLVTAEEVENLQSMLDIAGEQIIKSIDLDGLLELANTAADIEDKPYDLPEKSKLRKAPRIAIARDKAFSFYYEDNLDLLKYYGAELVFFSPLNDEELPENIDGIIFGGGYPELYLDILEKNKKMTDSIKKAFSMGKPCLAECGGFMYLHKTVEDKDGNPYKGVGVLDSSCENKSKLVRFGYALFTANEDNVILKKGETICGHEFHTWDSTNNGHSLDAKKPTGTRNWNCAMGNENILCGYPHLYYLSNPIVAKRFVEKCSL